MKRSLTNLLCGLQDGLRRRPDATEDIAPNDEYEKAYAAGTEVHDELVELLDGIEHGFRDAIDPRFCEPLVHRAAGPAYSAGYARGKAMAGAVRSHVAWEGRRKPEPLRSTAAKAAFCRCRHRAEDHYHPDPDDPGLVGKCRLCPCPCFDLKVAPDPPAPAPMCKCLHNEDFHREGARWCLVPTCSCDHFSPKPATGAPQTARWEVVRVVPGPPGLHYVHLGGPHPPYIGETVVRPPAAC